MSYKLVRGTWAMVGSLLMVAGALVAAPVAGAAPTDVIYKTEYRGVHKTYIGQYSGDWKHCVYVTAANYKQNVSCAKGATVAETISGGAGYSGDVISASVGFSVTFSSTVTSSITVTVNKGGSGWYDVGYRYDEYTIGMERRTCVVQNGSCGAWSSPTTATVQHHLGDTYNYFGTGAA